ncbi:MAG: FAD-dependent oxidoreductase [bacterium]
MKKYNFAIIGSGPAGYTAAIRASQLGKTVILFEKEHLGGVCLNKGCIPTKTFLYSADLYNSIKKASNFGIEIENFSLNFEKVVEKKEKTVEKLRKSLEILLKSHNIEIVNAEAKMVNGERKTMNGISLVEADGEVYECEHVLIATGSEPVCAGGFEFDHEFIVSSDDVLGLKTLPQKVLIVGSGAIGVEWARIFSAFGVDVSIVELADKLLPLADFEVSQRLERMFKMSKIKMFLSTSVQEIQEKKVTLSNGEVLEPDFVLFATGRKALATHFSPLTSHFIGDAYGSIQLAHFASHQGIQVVENIILGNAIEEFITPFVVYGNPEIAWAGATEQDLIAKNIEYKKSVFPVSALGKAATESNLEGFVKILADNEGKILGAHIISKEASALIHQLTIAMQNNLGVEELKKCCFAHPTYSEGIYESLKLVNGKQ